MSNSETLKKASDAHRVALNALHRLTAIQTGFYTVGMNAVGDRMEYILADLFDAVEVLNTCTGEFIHQACLTTRKTNGAILSAVLQNINSNIVVPADG